jgi:hypothetical protein
MKRILVSLGLCLMMISCKKDIGVVLPDSNMPTLEMVRLVEIPNESGKGYVRIIAGVYNSKKTGLDVDAVEQNYELPDGQVFTIGSERMVVGTQNTNSPLANGEINLKITTTYKGEKIGKVEIVKVRKGNNLYDEKGKRIGDQLKPGFYAAQSFINTYNKKGGGYTYEYIHRGWLVNDKGELKPEIGGEASKVNFLIFGEEKKTTPLLTLNPSGYFKAAGIYEFSIVDESTASFEMVSNGKCGTGMSNAVYDWMTTAATDSHTRPIWTWHEDFKIQTKLEYIRQVNLVYSLIPKQK